MALLLPLCQISWAGNYVTESELRTGLDDALESELASGIPEVSGEMWRDLNRFYDSRSGAPFWVATGGVERMGEQLALLLIGASEHGLDNERYHAAQLEQLLGSEDDQALARLELLLTHGLLRFVVDLHSGRPEIDRKAQDWFIERTDIEPLDYLRRVSRGESLQSVLDELAPPHPRYRDLQIAHTHYQMIADDGGWPRLQAMVTLERGKQHSDVSRLRRRLYLSGDLNGIDNSSNQFDEALTQAVIRFQQRHGLKEDGVVGPRTREVLNVPVELRMQQIRLNMERWRWMPRQLEEYHLQVNLADFSLQLIDDDRPQFGMKVIIGKNYSETPAFSGTVRYLVANPFWHVPRRLAVENLLPKQKQDKNYFTEKGIRVLQRAAFGSEEIDPAEVDWMELSRNNFPYRLRQDPGVKNSLGRIKFIFPNEHAIYLHDTPAQGLFEKGVRTFSGGCIRVAEPIKLASYLLGDEWSGEQVLDLIGEKETRRLNLSNRIPIYIIYMTAWVDEQGVMQFRNDVYGRDQRLAQQLQGLDKLYSDL
ncbi:hypothetical protein BOW53_15815 [Solemya pervernicosa gill symbiont]|uniref:L,D-TPase catalytic domain-containing protein n=1 Tax=Solemya pervernicosa gill symbiont TaxID=642797 RepID=A0A1T2KZU3_9GAMM|nr:hypothetical protein BOW53_15815 [Solemya pervernicosa gill symbiont]